MGPLQMTEFLFNKAVKIAQEELDGNYKHNSELNLIATALCLLFQMRREDVLEVVYQKASHRKIN
jgi:hypothetical protein